MEIEKPKIKILKILLKEFTIKHTITSLAREVSISRVGIWKILKKLEKEKLVVLSSIGEGRTSTYSISLNWDNPLTEKNLALALTEDAIKNQKLLSNFAELKNKVDFLIAYGSIINSPKDANDIDILGVVSNNNRFLDIEESVKKIQKIQIKNIHILNFTQIEFKKEIEKPNKVFIDAVKKGIILFGQEKFIRFVKKIYKK